jgi:excisionase family DNA binding protein
MNATSQAIQTLIENTPGYSLDVLVTDMGEVSGSTPEYMTSKEVRMLLNISRHTLKRWVDKGLLKAYTAGAGRNYRYRKSEVLAVFKQ